MTASTSTTRLATGLHHFMGHYSVLGLLAVDKDEEVRRAVAFNGSTSAEVLVKLAGRSIDLALLVAMNPDAPRGVIDALVEDRDPIVGYVAAGVRATRAVLTEDGVTGPSTGASTQEDETARPIILP